MTEERERSLVVTLVHGTFGRLAGRDASWTREGSFLRQRLLEELSPDVVFLPFRWSGMNWPSARYAAARRLRDHLRVTSERYPERNHFVLAHSHGGNVALYALRDAGAEPPPAWLPAGVVCLSTPFIAAQPRPETLFRFVATYAVVVVTLFAVVATLMGRLLIPWMAGVRTDDTVLNALMWNEVWLEFALCAVLAWHATNRLVRMARERRKLIAVGGVPVPLRIYRSIGDEATALLATSSFFTWLGTLAWRAASTLTLVVTGVFAVIVLALVAGPIGLLVLIERLFGGRRLRHRLTSAARSRRFWASVVAMGTMLAFAVWGFFLAGTPLGTADMSYARVVAVLVFAVVACSTFSGLGYGLTAPFLEVSAETTPPGSWQVHLFAARDWDGDERVPREGGTGTRSPSLAHSAAYGDSDVLRAIVAWIREREAVRRPARDRSVDAVASPDQPRSSRSAR